MPSVRVKGLSKVLLGLSCIVLCCDACSVAYPGFFKSTFMQEKFPL